MRPVSAKMTMIKSTKPSPPPGIVTPSRSYTGHVGNAPTNSRTNRIIKSSDINFCLSNPYIVSAMGRGWDNSPERRCAASRQCSRLAERRKATPPSTLAYLECASALALLGSGSRKAAQQHRTPKKKKRWRVCPATSIREHNLVSGREDGLLDRHFARSQHAPLAHQRSLPLDRLGKNLRPAQK